MSDAQYKAFISYSHADSAFARTLHRQLEGYVVPARLVGVEGANGLISKSLSPIFRDVDELPAAQDLTTEIKNALAQSAALIVLCSPAARQSIWVAKEVELFRALHGDTRPVLAAVIEGEPAEVLLPQLYLDKVGADPLAADFREGQDGKGLAFLKLVAGLTGASLGALVQRDAQRRLRRVMTITAIASIAMIAMATLMVLAMRARQEADRQRASAEGLIEYMLTDLREKLKGVGRQDVMSAVNERAMAYYGNSDPNNLAPESLEKRSRILHAMGEDDDREGKYSSSLLKFIEAQRTTAAILKQKPRDPNAIFAHAQSEYWVGRAAMGRKDYAKARNHWQNYLEQAKALQAAEPNTARSYMEIGYAHGNLCELEYRIDQDNAQSLLAARKACEASAKAEEAALALSPNDADIRKDVANRYGWLANVAASQKYFTESRIFREKEAALLKKLVEADPNNADLRLREIWNRDGLSRSWLQQGNLQEAIAIANANRSKYQLLLQQTGGRPDILVNYIKLLAFVATHQQKSRDTGWLQTLKEAERSVAQLKRTSEDRESIVALESVLTNIMREGRK